jgi:hypothetical protein
MMEACGSLAVRVEQALAADVAAVVPELVVLAPELGSLAVALGDGRLVLFGPGLFVNHGMALGLERAVTVGDLEVLEDLSEQVGVPAGVEVCPWSHPSLLALATSRGFLPRSFRTVLTRPLAGVHRPLETDGSVAAEPVVGGSDLTRWKEVTVLGFEYRDDRARQGSDLYADAVFAALGSTFFLARLDGRRGRWTTGRRSHAHRAGHHGHPGGNVHRPRRPSEGRPTGHDPGPSDGRRSSRL